MYAQVDPVGRPLPGLLDTLLVLPLGLLRQELLVLLLVPGEEQGAGGKGVRGPFNRIQNFL